MTDQWVPAPPQPPPPAPPAGLPPANSWAPVTPCAAADSPKIADGVIITGRPAIIAAMPWTITLNDGLNPPNFTIDHYDASGVLIEHPIAIDGTSGDVTLTHNPTQPLGVVTKQYVDANALTDAPNDGTTYARRNAAWEPTVPSRGGTFSGGVAFTAGAIFASPSNLNIGGGAAAQVLSAVGGGGALAWATLPIAADAPSDGQFYTRQNAAWAVAPGGMTDAPNDGTAYARKSVAWAHLTHLDITDWAATLANYYPTSNPSGYQTAAQVTAALAPYALTSSVPVASTTPPLMNGTAAVGTGATWARADHVHASDTSRYAATNPSGYQTAAQVTAVLPVASTVAPLINGTAAAGSSAAWSRGDHVHPVDTSRYAASNPSGFQTAAQVTASLGNYVPLAGNVVLTGPLTIGAGASPNALSLTIGSSNRTQISLYDSAGGNDRSDYYYNHTAGTAQITHNGVVTSLQLDSAGAFNYTGGTGVATKAGGGNWTAPSDARIKDVLGDYTAGLDEVLQLRPVEFAYKGNDTPTAELGRSTSGIVQPYAGEAPFPASPHFTVATNETPFVGFIAQELEAICPGMVTQATGFIDGEAVTDLRNVDVSNLVYALVNAVKTLAARVGQLEGVNG